MEKEKLTKRVNDLLEQCERKQTITATHFLTPAESFYIDNWSIYNKTDSSISLYGGKENCERKMCFFLPYYIDINSFDYSEYIKCIKITSRFGSPGHRDYMGALLNLGIKREWIGDIYVIENIAYVYCYYTIVENIISELKTVGRAGVKVNEIPLNEAPEIIHQFKNINFTVMSLRLDSIVSGLFNLSRNEAAKEIKLGKVSLNYEENDHNDKLIKENDIISLRGSGKGKIISVGGTTRKGRLIINAELYK